MLGSAVSSSAPRDCQPSSHMGDLGSGPLMNFHARSEPVIGCAYDAVGMHRALDSAIGLPRRSTSALWMLVFLMPPEVRRSFIVSFLGYIVAMLDAPISSRISCGGERRMEVAASVCPSGANARP